ncbi:MAG: citrate (Si)-synthase [bacterium]|nr:MAG: citrate (Si)-synthase [bacterium]
MGSLKEKLASQIPGQREEIRDLVKNYGDVVLSEATVAMAYGGMRGIKGLICDTSEVSPEKGLIIRGIPLLELTDKLPEEIFWLLVTGEVPSADELKGLQAEFSKRAGVPSYVWDVLRAMSKDSHPMAMISVGIMAMQNQSEFAKAYAAGVKKTEYWDSTLEDVLNLLAKLPELAAGIYRIRFNKGDLIPPDPKLDWGGNYAHMMGIPDPDGNLADLMRLYLTLHSDHESGNVSAHVCHTVGSALSDFYYALSAGLNGLAGPLHGLANQECLAFVLQMIDKFGGAPNDEQLTQYCWDTLNGGKVIPGYGHAVLRVTDPRFTAQVAWGKERIPEDPVFQTVAKMFDLVPGILKEHGKAKNPWPNVDAASGSLVYHFGITEFSYYTVLFSVSRALGVGAQLIYNRALGAPIERPKSVTTDFVRSFVTGKK